MSQGPQLGMFGVAPTGREMHTVAAHHRLLADGSEVFVSEHLRWSRGRRPSEAEPGGRTGPSSRAQPAVAAAQLALFDAGPRLS